MGTLETYFKMGNGRDFYSAIMVMSPKHTQTSLLLWHLNVTTVHFDTHCFTLPVLLLCNRIGISTTIDESGVLRKRDNRALHVLLRLTYVHLINNNNYVIYFTHNG